MKVWNKILLGIAGVLIMAVGVLMFVYPMQSVQGMAFVIGLLTLIAGAAILAFFFSGIYLLFGSAWVLFDGLATIAIGVLFLCYNNLVAGALPYLFGAWLMFTGIQEAVAGMQLHHFHISQWWLSLLLGIIGMVLGFLCFWQPIGGSVALSYVVGVGLVCFGISLLVTLGRINSIQKFVKEIAADL